MHSVNELKDTSYIHVLCFFHTQESYLQQKQVKQFLRHYFFLDDFKYTFQSRDLRQQDFLVESFCGDFLVRKGDKSLGGKGVSKQTTKYRMTIRQSSRLQFKDNLKDRETVVTQALQTWIYFSALVQACCAIPSKFFRARWYLAADPVKVRVDLKRRKGGGVIWTGAPGKRTQCFSILSCSIIFSVVRKEMSDGNIYGYFFNMLS